MRTNRRKAVKDKKKHQIKVLEWHTKCAKKVAKRLMGNPIGIQNSSGSWEYQYSYFNSQTGASTPVNPAQINAERRIKDKSV